MEPAGQDPGARQGPGTDQSTALFAEGCQSFLDNFIAGFSRARASLTGCWQWGAITPNRIDSSNDCPSARFLSDPFFVMDLRLRSSPFCRPNWKSFELSGAITRPEFGFSTRVFSAALYCQTSLRLDFARLRSSLEMVPAVDLENRSLANYLEPPQVFPWPWAIVQVSFRTTVL